MKSEVLTALKILMLILWYKRCFNLQVDVTHVPTKRLYLPKRPHGVTIQKNIDIFTTVITSKLTECTLGLSLLFHLTFVVLLRL